MNILNHPLTAYSLCFLTHSASAGLATAQRLGELIFPFLVPCVAVHLWQEYCYMSLDFEVCREGRASEILSFGLSGHGQLFNISREFVS